MSLKRQRGPRSHINLTIDKDTSLKIDKFAEHIGMSRSYAIEYMCRDFLNDKGVVLISPNYD